jgi:hypothetical protein
VTQQLAIWGPPPEPAKCRARIERRGEHPCTKPAGHDGPHYARWAMTFGEAYWQDEPAERQSDPK